MRARPPGRWSRNPENERLDEGEPERKVLVDRSYIDSPTDRDRVVKETALGG